MSASPAELEEPCFNPARSAVEKFDRASVHSIVAATAAIVVLVAATLGTPRVRRWI